SPAYSIPTSLFSSLSFTGTGNNDVFNIDLTNGNPIPSGGVQFTGSGNNSKLELTGSSGDDGVALSSGTLSANGSANATFSNVSIVTLDTGSGNDTADYNGATGVNLAFHGGSGADTLNVNA